MEKGNWAAVAYWLACWTDTLQFNSRLLYFLVFFAFLLKFFFLNGTAS